MHKYILLVILSLLVQAGLVNAADDFTAHKTVTTVLLKTASDKAVAVYDAYASAGAKAPKPVTFTVGGAKQVFYIAEPASYYAVFKATGGPILRALGLNFSFCMNPISPVFLVYNAFLVLMIGFHWFGIMNNVSKGKGGLEIIPLFGKLCMGIVVCYNMPWVYQAAMTLKSVGEQVVILALSDTSGGAPANVANADIGNIKGLNSRDEGVKEAVLTSLKGYLFPIVDIPVTTTDAKGNTVVVDPAIVARNSGRQRLADLVADLNTKIDAYNKQAQIVGSDASGATKTTSLGGRIALDFVGFDGIPANGYLKMAATGAAGITRQEATSSPAILNKLADDSSAAKELSKLYQRKLFVFMKTLSCSYSSAQNAIDDISTGIVHGAFVYSALPLGDQLLPVDQNMDAYSADSNGIDGYQVAVTQVTQDFITGSIMTAFENDVTGVPDSALSAISAMDKTWTIGKKILKWTLVPASLAWDAGKWALGKAGDLAQGIWSWFADILCSMLRHFWVPLVAKLANFMFDLLIESYVYILWLAYPFWFYSKTQKAFTGALDTLISASFTAATFYVLIVAFDGFAGMCIHSIMAALVLGGAGAVAGVTAAASGAAAATTTVATALIAGNPVGATVIGAGAVAAGTVAAGVIVALMFGYVIFYIVGTLICLKLAPQIFKAFKEGSSVVTPMVMGGLAAVGAGLAGGVLAASSAANMANKAGGTASAIGKAGLSKPGAMMAQRRIRADQAAGIAPRLGDLDKVKNHEANVKARGAAIDRTWASAKEGIKDIAKNPGKALMTLAGSNVGKIAMIIASGASGDPSAMVKTVAGAALAQTTLERLGQSQDNVGAPSAYANQPGTPMSQPSSIGSSPVAPPASGTTPLNVRRP